MKYNFPHTEKEKQEKDDEFCPIAKLLEKKGLRCRWVREQCKRQDKRNYTPCKIRKRIKFKILNFIKRQKKPITIRMVAKGIGKQYHSVKKPFKELFCENELVMVKPKTRNKKGIFEPALYSVPKKAISPKKMG